MLQDIQMLVSNAHGGLDAFNPRTPELYSPTGKVLPQVGVGDIGYLTDTNGDDDTIQHVYHIYNR